MAAPILIAGAAGQLGAAFVHACAGRDVIAHSRATLDITNPDAVRRAVVEAAPAVVINCAAFNDVDGAEDTPAEAFEVNAMAVRSLARAAEAAGATFVHFSSDFVFDGEAREPYREDAPASPRSTYAMSKLVGEWFALDYPHAYVMRVESLFGTLSGWPGRRGTLESIVVAMEQGREVKAFTDRVVSPSYVPDVAAATLHLLEKAAAPGLYHCVNSGHATWYDVALETARAIGVAAVLAPTTTTELRLRAPRPLFCALDNGKVAEAGFVMPAWQDAVARWIGARGRPAA
jgi:dTDP-4-dehydrorhamnose reductase